MKLSDLLEYDDIVVQCHDNPDADALASGFGLYTYFKSQGKDVRFIYRGRNKVQKSNLVIMLDELNIPVEYEPDFVDKIGKGIADAAAPVMSDIGKAVGGFFGNTFSKIGLGKKKNDQTKEEE